MRRTKYALEFKDEAVRQVIDRGHPVVDVAKRLGISESVLYTWVSKFKKADAGYQCIQKRPDAKADVRCHVAMRPGKRKALNKENAADALIDKAEKIKAGIRAKVEHPFRVIKRQFGFVKVRFRGLQKNTAQLFTLFALSNLWMVRGKLMEAQA